MNILAIDTSGPAAGVAILREGLLCYEATARNKMTHSANLMPMVEEALKRVEIELQQLDLLAAVVGPGSFTGVRIGVSAIKGMALGLQKPCVAVNALEALAQGVAVAQDIVCPIRDARAGQVYGAAFQGQRRLMEDAVLKLPDYVERLAALGTQHLFVGDGAEVHEQALRDMLGDAAQFAPAHVNALKAGAAAIIALQHKDAAVSGDDLVPLYLRKPQAQREREQRGE